MPLVGVVVDRGVRRRRILDARAAVQELAGREIVDRPGAAAIGECRLQEIARARRHGGVGAGIAGAGFQLDVDHAGLAEAVLGGQRAGDQRHLAGILGGQRIGEQRQPFGQLHAVQPVLQVAVVAAHVELAETVLRHARRAHQHLVDRRLLALRHGVDGARREIVARRAEAGLDRAARLVQAGRGHGDAGQRAGGRRRRRLGDDRRRNQDCADCRCPIPSSHRPFSYGRLANVIL